MSIEHKNVIERLEEAQLDLSAIQGQASIEALENHVLMMVTSVINAPAYILILKISSLQKSGVSR